jgi:hypothetical protein
MIGNVAEWTADWYGNYSSTPVIDPTGPLAGSVRVARGGTWGNSDNYSRSSTRHRIDPAESWLGFRVALKEINPNGTGNDQSSETSSKFNTERTDDGILLRWENGYPTQVGFRDFLDAVVQGKGAYSEDNGLSELPFTDCLKVVNDIRDGYEAESYYRNLIGNALIQLGFKINL